MTTLVSGFISNINNREDRNLEIYYNLAKKILKSEIPKIIFVDELMFELISVCYDCHHNRIHKK